ncbi:glutamyl-trna amidotransferase subunit a [Lentinula edodes]|uniref:Glutamyl-trna amidotransferase subunit a n=1 Tax=Lentinula edodes TaxID=5353 RepID=A0A1Q3ED93_LENED|nr:glutamyl-trna amidotransferase subunit a [Lentinula edodes]
MSYTKPSTTDKVADTILGCFSVFAPSEFTDHLVRYLGTWSGSDKLFAIIEYALKLLVPLLNKRARFRNKVYSRQVTTSSAAARVSKLAGTISDSRTLWRFWGLLTIIKWMISLEHNAQPTRKLLNIERLQGWSMVGYYPLEHLSYLVSHDILPSRSMVHRKLLQAKYHALRKAGLKPAEKQEIQKRWHAYWSDLLVNLINFPLALHWSTGSTLIKHDSVVALLNLIVAVMSFRSGWIATALPSPASVAETTDNVVEPVAENVTAYDA